LAAGDTDRPEFLRPGRCRVVVTAIDPQGRESPPATVEVNLELPDERGR
jgi:hypothetical protein